MKLSIIIPCKNLEGVLFKLHEGISDLLEDLKYEIIFVDDCSSDKTLDDLNKIYENDMRHVKVLAFSRSFKKEAAILAGLEYSTGEYTCIIDDNFEFSYKYLKVMLNYLENNCDYDAVSMVKSGKIKNNFSNIIYKRLLCAKFGNDFDPEMEMLSSNFRMFNNKTKSSLIEISKKNNYSKDLYSWIGYKTKYLTYNENDINTNLTSNCELTLKKNIEDLLLMAFNPLKIVSYMGVITICFAFLYLFILLFQAIFLKYEIMIIYVFLFFLLFLFGLLFIFIGFIGKYLRIIYDEIKSRPLYIIKEKKGFDNETIL